MSSLDDLELTYRAVGATADPFAASSPPDGYRGIERTARIGTGSAHFAAASKAVLEWGVQRGSGFGIRGSQVVTEGSTVTLLIPFGPFRVPAAARVVFVVREPRRVGFAYGTLPGHPENGEEAFIVEHRDDDSVWIDIRAFSRPANRFWWLVSPVLRLTQEFYTRRYLRSLA
ncbi:uncharacterized protein (UPF0548 family) [Salinibacterium sp. CAN_S4]|uniref:DUF1990 family protein n=1 Tax=Salinibacterium sp. CAN_S4 TaxID=2787727 RepID=UPI001A2894F2